MEEFIGIGIVGVALSLVIEWIKAKFGTDSTQTKGLTIVLSIAVGAAYFLLRETLWWTTILGILASASTMYSLVLKKKTS